MPEEPSRADRPTPEDQPAPDGRPTPHDRDAMRAVGPAGILAFLVELWMIALLALAGWRIGGGAAVGVIRAVFFVVVAVVVWARWLAPTSARRLARGPRLTLKAALYAVTAVLVALTGLLPLALAFAVVAAASLAWARD